MGWQSTLQTPGCLETMQRKPFFTVLAVALVAVGLWYAARWRRTLTPPAPQPSSAADTTPASTATPATQAVPRRQQSDDRAATHVPTPFPEPSPIFGAIRGRVLDDQNRPVAGAEVEAMGPMGGLTQSARTSDRGVFTIRDVDVSYNKTYTLIPTKEEAGYGHPFNRFYMGRPVKPPEVTVRENQTVSCGDLYLGPQGGRLMGTIRDAKTNRPITVTQQMVLRRVDDPNLKNSHGLDADGRFSVLVPAVPFTVEVSAPGYQKKTFESMRLKSGEIRRFDILLTPAN